MSTGFSCNLGYSIPSNWAFDQFDEESFATAVVETLAVVAIVAVICLVASTGGVGALLEFLASGGFLLLAA